MTTARRAKKSSAGYDLTRLMVGSEGTLGIITELTLRLAGIPEAIASGVCPFPSVEAACNATILTIQSGIPVARIELLDALQVRACNLYSKLVAAGNADAVSWNFTAPRRASPSSRSASARSRRSSAAGRSTGRPAPRTARGCGRRGTMPIGRQRAAAARHAGAVVRRLRADLAARRMRRPRPSATPRTAGLLAPIVGHVGDGNFHVGCWSISTTTTRSRAPRSSSNAWSSGRCAMDGTCTGEHGIGQGKMKYLQAEHGAPALDAMRAIKRALDPLDIMNPGKIFSL